MASNSWVIEIDRFRALPREIRDQVYDFLAPHLRSKRSVTFEQCEEVLLGLRLNFKSNLSQIQKVAEVHREARQRFFGRKALHMKMEATFLDDDFGDRDSAALFGVFTHVQFFVLHLRHLNKFGRAQSLPQLGAILKLLIASPSMKSVKVGMFLEARYDAVFAPALQVLVDTVDRIANQLEQKGKLAFYVNSWYDWKTLQRIPASRDCRWNVWTGSFGDLVSLIERLKAQGLK